MRPLRLLLVTQRFWPRMDGPARLAAEVAVELAARDCRPTILTARWQPQWPAEVAYRGLPVVRIGPAPGNGWTGLRYMRAVGRWLRRHRAQFDLVCVSTLQREACAAACALRGNPPLVLRAERAGQEGDCAWYGRAPCGPRIKRRCLTAAAVVAGSPCVERELHAAGYAPAQIHAIANGVRVPPARTPEGKAAARAVLAEVQPALILPQWAPLAVYAGRLDRRRGLHSLVAAWQAIVRRWPNAQLWLAGEGPDRQGIERQVEALNLTGRVLLPGAFDSVEELLAAADAYVSPALEPGTGLGVLEAMAAGVPVVAADVAAHRACLTHGEHGLLVPGDEVRALAAALQRLFDDPALAARLGAAARQRAEAQFSLADMAERHLTLFRNLVT